MPRASTSMAMPAARSIVLVLVVAMMLPSVAADDRVEEGKFRTFYVTRKLTGVILYSGRK